MKLRIFIGDQHIEDTETTILPLVGSKYKTDYKGNLTIIAVDFASENHVMYGIIKLSPSRG